VCQGLISSRPMSAKSAQSRVASDAPWARAVAAITASAVAIDRPNRSRCLSNSAYQWAASLVNDQTRPANSSAIKASQLCCRFCLRRPSGSRARLSRITAKPPLVGCGVSGVPITVTRRTELGLVATNAEEVPAPQLPTERNGHGCDCPALAWLPLKADWLRWQLGGSCGLPPSSIFRGGRPGCAAGPWCACQGSGW